MELALTVVLLVALLGVAVLWHAGRLDRLHVRVEAARAALDAQLLRRAAVAAELAAYAEQHRLVPVPTSTAVTVAARVASGPVEYDREGVENDLSRGLRALVEALPAPDALGETRHDATVLLADLDNAVTRVGLARSFYNGAVQDTRTLRRTRLVRWLHLAGHAPLPPYFEIDDTALPVPPAAPVPLPAPRSAEPSRTP